MTETIHCDIGHIKQGLSRIEVKRSKFERLEVWDTECIMRGITYEEMRERNILDYAEGVCTMKKVATGAYEFTFHENILDESYFEWRGFSDNTTRPEEMSEQLERVVSQLESKYSNLYWDFAELSAASIGHDGFTDFEFEFEVILQK